MTRYGKHACLTNITTTTRPASIMTRRDSRARTMFLPCNGMLTVK